MTTFKPTDEVDFVIVEAGNPVRLIEAKWGDADVVRGLRYLKSRFPGAEAVQISATGKKDFLTPGGIRVRPAVSFLAELV